MDEDKVTRNWDGDVFEKVEFSHSQADALYKNKNKKPIEDPHKKIKQAINFVAETPGGEYFLQWLCEYLGFKDSTIAMSKEGVVDIKAMIYNEARRVVWKGLRNFLEVENRNRIEADKSC